MNSFELYDPTVVQTSHHYEDSHKRKAEHEHYASSISATINDLIHVGVVDMEEDDLSEDDMMEMIAMQMYYMSHTFD